MKFEGDYQGLYKFLLALEGQPRIMRVRQMSLKEMPAQKGAVSAEMEISIFFEEGQGSKPCTKKA
jgi:hypothetical protein